MWFRGIPLCFAVVFVFAPNETQSLKLADYIKPCHRSDPKFSECATRNGQVAYPHVLRGDRKYRFQSMQPLQVTSLKVDDRGGPIGLVIDMKNISIYGFDTFKLNKADADFEKKFLLFNSTLERAEFLCDYNISGKMLILPITGSGPANFTFTNFRMNYKVSYDLYEKPNGKVHMKLTDSDLKFEYDKAYLLFEGLFNGKSPLLAEQMKNFIDENSGLLVTELGPTVSGAISSAFVAGFAYVVDKIPFDELFFP